MLIAIPTTATAILFRLGLKWVDEIVEWLPNNSTRSKKKKMAFSN